MDRLVISFAIAVSICGAFYLVGLLVLELFKHYGTNSILTLIVFVGVWISCYLMITD